MSDENGTSQVSRLAKSLDEMVGALRHANDELRRGIKAMVAADELIQELRAENRRLRADLQQARELLGYDS